MGVHQGQMQIEAVYRLKFSGEKALLYFSFSLHPPFSSIGFSSQTENSFPSVMFSKWLFLWEKCFLRRMTTLKNLCMLVCTTVWYACRQSEQLYVPEKLPRRNWRA